MTVFVQVGDDYYNPAAIAALKPRIATVVDPDAEFPTVVYNSCTPELCTHTRIEVIGQQYETYVEMPIADVLDLLV